MSDLNQVVLSGHVSNEPTARTLEGGRQVVSFSVASKYSKGPAGEGSVYVTCAAWGRMAEALHGKIAKGARVVVVGELRVRSYEKDGVKRWVTEVNVTAAEVAPTGAGAREQVGLFGGAPAPAPRAPAQQTPGPEDRFADDRNDRDDEIPF